MTHERSAVGIVMPTHGDNRFLATAVQSVIAQTFTDWTLVIVCDGVAQETGQTANDLAARDPRIRVVRQQRLGVAAARNRGLRELGPHVELIALLDHDDRWLPSALQSLVRALTNAPLAVGAHGLGRFVDEAGTQVRIGEMEGGLRTREGLENGRGVEWPLDRPTTFANLAICSCIAVGTALMHRVALERVGSFDERAVPADDYDMWVRLSRIGDFAFVDEVVMEYRQHVAPTWIRPRGTGRGLPYVRQKIMSSPDNTPIQAQMATQGYLICQASIVKHALAEAVRSVGQRRYSASARHLLRAVRHAGAYVDRLTRRWIGSR